MFFESSLFYPDSLVLASFSEIFQPEPFLFPPPPRLSNFEIFSTHPAYSNPPFIRYPRVLSKNLDGLKIADKVYSQVWKIKKSPLVSKGKTQI